MMRYQEKYTETKGDFVDALAYVRSMRIDHEYIVLTV